MASLDKHHKAPFGRVLGFGPGHVEVYSSDYDTADMPNRHAFRSMIDDVYMGYKWQCVELARRWLYINKGYVFEDVAMAYDIFRLRDVTVVADGSKLPLQSFPNGAKRPPEPGCLLIWNEGGEFNVTGHVAVVTEVFADRVRCIEQNVEDKVWPQGIHYSRELTARTDEEGRYWIDCTFENSGILGWVIQTADATFAENMPAPDPGLFNIHRRPIANLGQAAQPWLNPANPDEAAYITMMGGHLLSSAATDPYAYFRISETARNEIKRATNELHAMFMHATDRVLQDDALLAAFNLPPALVGRIRQSWDNRRNQMIAGRFDFSLSERGLKVFEYNCDSSSCYMEAGKVQGLWADHFGVTEGRDCGEKLFSQLKDAWAGSAIDTTLHILHDTDPEEIYHAQFMKTAMEAAGLSCKLVTGVSSLRWGVDGQIIDADGEEIKWVWKTWAWETALDQIRDQISEDDENLRLGKTIDRASTPPRLVDVLLRPDVMVFEPLWTLIPSNKAMLPILWSIFPNHPYLLNTLYTLSDELKHKGYVVKPIVGRCGENIRIVDDVNHLVSQTDGQFDDQQRVYQELFPLPRINGLNVQVCSFSVAGRYGGACLRADPSAVITADSDILPLRIVSDESLET